jgi:hypothetical protein
MSASSDEEGDHPADADDTALVDAETDMCRTTPAYNFKVWVSGAGHRSLNCAPAGGYCFLCEHVIVEDEDAGAQEEDADNGADNSAEYNDEPVDDNAKKQNQLRTAIKEVNAYITWMAQTDTDVISIVATVQKHYDTKIKHLIVLDLGDDTIVTGPEWKHDTIVRHLMKSVQWKSIFSAACGMMLRSMVLKANDRVIDETTDTIIVKNADVLCRMISEYNKHEMHQARVKALGVRTNRAAGKSS